MQFEIRKEYKRTDIHEAYGGQRQGGISTPAEHNVIFLFSSARGEEYGYIDGWRGNTFYYSGEGQKGDMEFTRGNRAIQNHIYDGKELHLFITTRKGYVQYEGEMRYSGYEMEKGPDLKNNPRNIIMFKLERA